VRLRDYELTRCLATGGMGAVYLARKQVGAGFDKEAVVKVIRAELRDRPEVAAMFHAEARVAALSHHPNVVSAIDAGDADGTLFLVFEYHRGWNLRTVLQALDGRDEALSVARVLRIAIDAARGLDHVHTLRDHDGAPLRAVHRDVSPDNLVLGVDGQTKLLDFGIATFDGAATAPGLIKGKGRYMAPEQARGEPVTAAGDCYALELVVIDLLVGLGAAAPGAAAGPRDVAALRARRSDVPVALAESLIAALEPEPAQRPTAAALVRAWEAVRAGGALLADRRELAAWVAARAGAVTPPASTAPAASIAPATVPAPAGLRAGATDPFVGRREDLDACAAALAAGARVVTVTGPAGVGKTRLVDELIASPPAGVDLIVRCALGPVRGGAEVIAAVATALGVALTSDTDLGAAQDRVGYALAARSRPLLVLDDAEHVAAAVAGALPAWLARAPAMRAVVTSQEPLALAVETVLRLEPLPLPAARELFAVRAAAHGRAIDVGARPDAVITEIVDAVDRLPLGIELAAAWAPLLPLEALRDRLRADMSMLRNQRRDADPRHASLAAAIEGAWHRLAPWERAALAQCTVFRGPFSVGAAEAVVALDADAPPVLDVIAGLCRRSLLAIDPGAVDGPVVRLLHSVHAFAAAQLAADPEAADAAAARHHRHALVTARELGGNLDRPDRAAALQRFERSLPDLVAAFERATAFAPADAHALALALDPLLGTRGPARLHRTVLDAAVETARGPVRAQLLAARTRMRAALGDGDGAAADAAAAVELAEASGDPAIRIDALLAAARHHVIQRRFDRAATDAGRAAAIAEAAGAGATRARGRALAIVARSQAEMHAYAEALGSFDRALALHHDAGDVVGLQRTLAARGLCRFAQNDADGARADLERAAGLCDTLGDRAAEAEVVRYLAFVEAELGEHAAARGHLGRSLAIAADLALLPELAILYNNLGVTAMEEGHLGEAETRFQHAAALARRIGLEHRTALAIGNLGILQLLRGDPERGAALLEEALAAVGDRHPTWTSQWIFLGHLAAVSALAGRFDAAAAQLARAYAGVLSRARPVLDVLAGAQRLGRARGALDAGDNAAAWAALSEHAAAVVVDPAPSADIRLATAVIAAARAALEQRAAIRIDRAGLSLTVPGRAAIELDRKPVVRTLVRALVDARLAAPGQAVPCDDLVAVTWPGDRSDRASLIGRLRVAIGELRRLGIGDAVRAKGGGYLLGEEVPVIVDGAGAAAAVAAAGT
jgi:predicted ATPase